MENINMGNLSGLLPINRTVQGAAVTPDTGQTEFYSFNFVVNNENEFAPSLLVLMESCRDYRVPPKTFVEIASLLIFGDESEDHIARTLLMITVVIEALGDDAP